MHMESDTKSCTEAYLCWLETSTGKFGVLLVTVQVFYPAILILITFFPATDQLEVVQMEDGKNKIVASGC